METTSHLGVDVGVDDPVAQIGRDEDIVEPPADVALRGKRDLRPPGVLDLGASNVTKRIYEARSSDSKPEIWRARTVSVNRSASSALPLLPRSNVTKQLSPLHYNMTPSLSRKS